MNITAINRKPKVVLTVPSRVSIGMLLCVVFSSTITLSQGKKVATPSGESILSTWSVTVDASTNSHTGFAIVSSNVVKARYQSGKGAYEIPEWKPESGSIIAAKTFETIGVMFLKVLVKDANNNLVPYMLDYRSANIAVPPIDTKFGPVTQTGGSQGWLGVDGDALYVLSTSFLYVYRDSISSWQVDTAGLYGSYINGIALDTAQYVYAATTNRLLRQHPDTSIWRQVDSLRATNLYSVYVDRRNRIYVGSNSNGVYMSSDNGSTWVHDTAGMGNVQITKWGDDKFGNIYAINSSIFYRSIGGTQPWTRIDSGISAITVNPPTINSIGGDSVLYAATTFGLFSSIDQGTTWTDENQGMPAQKFFGFAKSKSGKWITSTSLAMFAKNPSDTSWSKVFPMSGYLGGLPISIDGVGNLYTWGYSNSTNWLFKSTDNGSTWNADTVGYAQLPGGFIVIDEKGGQHWATSQWGNSFYSKIYSKPLGGSWSLDTASFKSTNYSTSSSFASDKHGYLYVSGSYANGYLGAKINAIVMRRPINGGPWTPDTAGLGTLAYFTRLTPDKNGMMIGGIASVLYKRVNGLWSLVPTPTSIPSYISPHVDAVSIDSSNAIFVAFSNSGLGIGVYFTRDTGATWTLAGLDSVNVNQLVSYGDSTFAATRNGLYILTRKAAGATSVGNLKALPMTYALYQNYPNPFNPTTTISYQLPTLSKVSLKIYDLLGREVETLVNGEMNAGVHQVSFDATRFASGVYFYRLQAGNFTATKKLVLLK